VVVLQGELSNPSSPLVRAVRAYRRLDLADPRPNRPPRAPLKRFVWLTPDQAATVVERYQAGATVYELGRQFGISRKTVSAHLQRAGIPTRYRLLDGQAVAQATRLYLDGWSLARIASHFNVSPSTVHTALRQAGVPMRDSHGRVRT